MHSHKQVMEATHRPSEDSQHDRPERLREGTRGVVGNQFSAMSLSTVTICKPPGRAAWGPGTPPQTHKAHL